MRFDVITLFPEMVETVGHFGVTGRAVERGQVELVTWNPRDYTEDRHRTVDDRPYGGGPGMVMKYEPVARAIAAARAVAGPRSLVHLSPQGKPLDQATAQALAERPGLILLSGRYEGIDERLIEAEVDEEISIGDYVLSGGELAAMVLIDAVSRLLPGVLGASESAEEDSFVGGLLDYPHYTRPETVAGRAVPAVLLGGNHEQVRRWRLKQALGRTWLRRPELLDRLDLDEEQSILLREFQMEHGGGN